MDSRLRRSVLRTALHASVGSQTRLGANLRPLPPEGGASVEWLYPSMRTNEQQMTKICC